MAHDRIGVSLLSLILLSVLLAVAALADSGSTTAVFHFVGWYFLLGLGLYHLLNRISRRTREDVK
ncbi:MAG: hypothetical protein ACE5KH_02575 [Candidatus Geothermarchaeales archaeon]